MFGHRVTDWDDAYANGANIPRGERWPDAWVAPAADFRAGLAARAGIDHAYGPGARERFDLFRPEGAARGLAVFIHGGFWMRLDKSFWSHLAAGALAHGWAVAMPSYPLAPDARIADIAGAVARAVAAAAALVPGPVRLSGHSAGGHLAARMVCEGGPLDEAVAARVERVVSISGVHDLRPMLRTKMNETLRLDAAEARAESPALLEPRAGVRLTCWVGATERAEFVRQNALLASAWRGCGLWTEAVAEPDRHHFDVIDGLADPSHPLAVALAG